MIPDGLETESVIYITMQLHQYQNIVLCKLISDGRDACVEFLKKTFDGYDSLSKQETDPLIRIILHMSEINFDQESLEEALDVIASDGFVKAKKPVDSDSDSEEEPPKAKPAKKSAKTKKPTKKPAKAKKPVESDSSDSDDEPRRKKGKGKKESEDDASVNLSKIRQSVSRFSKIAK